MKMICSILVRVVIYHHLNNPIVQPHALLRDKVTSCITGVLPVTSHIVVQHPTISYGMYKKI